MVAVLFAAGTALATFTCSLELVIYKRTSTNWIPTARALSQNVCVGTLLCVGIAGSFVGVLGARGPHDDDHTKTDTRHHQVTGSESHEETLEELPASRTPTGTGSDGTPEEAAAPKHAVPVQGVSSPGRQSHYRGSRREGAAGIFRRETGSASASDAAENVGLAHMVSMPGRGEVPYGWLAIELLRKEASQLRALWGNEKRFVQQSVGRTIVGKSSRFTSSQVKSLVVHAKNRYRMRSTARLQAAAKLESTAEDVAAKLQAAGVELPPSTGYSTLPPAPSYQDSRAGTDASAPGTASVSEAREQTIQSYVRCGVSRLREEATELEEMSTNKHLYVAQSLAMRILRSVRQITTPLIISEWRNEARKAYNQKMRRSRGRVETLRTLAEEWEKRLASGALAHEDPDEGTSGKRKRQRASGTETTTGRPCARPVPLAGRQCERQRKQAARQSVISEAPRAPSMISSSQADQTEGSLRGTVLGSRVELPGLGSVPYVKLAIDKLRLDAALLRRKWGDEEKYMKGRIAENMHEENNRMPVPAVLSRWIRRARHKQHCRRRMRLQESADYDKLATEIERRAVADGILLQSGPASPLHGAECADVLEATEFEEGSGGPRASGRGPAEVTFAHLAIENRRHQAEAIDATWGHGEEKFVAEHVAYHMVRRNQPSPDLRTLQVWTASARTSYRSRARARQAKASQLKAQADALEQELRDLLSSTPSRAAEPARESASTAGQSSELPSGKRRQKRKHLSPSGSGSFGEGPSRGGATLPPLSLWLTPVSTFRLWRRQRRLRTAQVTSGPGSASPASLQLHPTEAASEKASGHSLPTPVPATRSTGVPLPPAALALSTTTPLHPAGSGSSAGVPAAPQPKKRRLLDFVSAQAAAHQLAPQMHTPPPGQISGTSTQIPSEHLPLGPREASGPSLTSFLSTGHATPFGPVSEIIPPRCLPLKKRPLREPAATIQSPTADVATSGPRRVSSDSLTVSSTSSGSHSQAPASTDSPAPTSAPHGVRGVGPRIRRGAPEPR